MMLDLFRSVLDTDRAPVVLCTLDHIIVYMNPAATAHYARHGGAALLGSSLLDCHTPPARERIEEVLRWFSASRENNMIYTYRNDRENKDVYMVALRDGAGALIGYYEKHEYRQGESAELYDFSRSLI